MWNLNCVFIVIISIASINCWKLPELPANKRTQYYLIQNDGGYKYGFDTGNGYFGKQIANSKNEVFGHYAYPIEGNLVGVRYTSGVNGFIPEDEAATQSQWDSTVDHTRQESSDNTGQVQGEYSYTDETGKHHLYYTDERLAEPNILIPIEPTTWSNEENLEQPGSSDGSYSFHYDTGDHSHQESSDYSGNVKGSYSYQNQAGNHDLTYVAGADTGFVVTGGSLALPAAPQASLSWPTLNVPAIEISTWVDPGIYDAQHSGYSDGSYSFQYNAGDHSRQESSDPSGNVKGSFSYQNQAGHHDLSYVAGSDTGFVVTGGNLAPHGSEASSSSWSTLNTPAISTATWAIHGNSATPVSIESTLENQGTYNGDGSYSFEYDTGNHYRKESADKDGHVQGKYGYNDEAGHHDLSYKAGDHYGFIVTGDNLAEANIKTNKIHSWENSTAASFEVHTNTINTGSLTIQGESETSSQINQDQVTEISTVSSGSQFNIVVEETATEEEATTTWKSVEKTENHDKSYSFEYDTGNHYRKESADKDGHVQGKYGYKDEAGHHDLTYKAGDDYGFIATGGSLAVPNGLNTGGSTAQSSEASIKSTSIEYLPPLLTVVHSPKSSDEHNDGSYSFEYDTGNHYRKEAADKDGHVKGQYEYKDEAGKHDLSYKAGDHYGFVVTGGNLAPTTHKKIYSFHKSTLTGGIESNTVTADSSTIEAESATSWDVNQGISDLTTTESAVTQWNTIFAASTVEDDYQESTEALKSLEHNDGSYSFEYDTGSHYRKESADKDGHVVGKYGYKDEAGNHDLTYKAGDDYGFIATGGSLAEPNGLNGKTISDSSLKSNEGSQQPETDVSYSFKYNAGDHTRQESSDSSGHVKGTFSYQDEAGQHDLSYISGPETGFVVTGGNLAEQNNNAGSLKSESISSNSK